MTENHVGDALTREHHEIDAGIERFSAALDGGTVEPDALAGTFAALRRHIYLEEELLFPPLRRAGLMMPIMVMVKEHGELWQQMNEIEERLGSDDRDTDALRSDCERLLGGLGQHNMKEEPIVYPHAATDLTPDEEGVLADFIDTGRTPSGWVCAALR